jgi:hypothetical protein
LPHDGHGPRFVSRQEVRERLRVKMHPVGDFISIRRLNCP